VDKLVIVSADGHAGCPPEGYLQYIDPEFRSDITENLVLQNNFHRKVMPTGLSRDAATLEVMDAEHRLRDGGEVCEYDWKRRLDELDHEGVAGEVIQWGVVGNTNAFFSILNDACSRELRAAGARAFHRFLADGIAFGQGRFVGVLEPSVFHDMDTALAELEWGAVRGFKAVAVRGNTQDLDLPPLHDAHWEPLWRRCVDLGLHLNAHAGWGMAQGILSGFIGKFFDKMQGDGVGGQGDFTAARAGSMMELEGFDTAQALSEDDDSPFQLDMLPRRLLWQLMLAGVFDRHPELQFVLTEVRADWLPATLAHLDARFDRGDTPLKRRPSEYWHKHCWTVPSSVHTCEMRMRHELGMDKMMFGIDLPHPESTWPNTRDWIRHTFRGVDEPEARDILGGRAIELYGFDRDVLGAVASRIGPEPADVLGDFDIPRPLLDTFHARAGLDREAEQVDVTIIDQLLDEDLKVSG
jgi:predicted TIM-barrel fold metal-dependent hydrolase